MNPDHFHPIVTYCNMSTDCMCLVVRGRADPSCSHFRKASMSKSAIALPIPTLRELMQHKPVWERPPCFATPAELENAKLVEAPGAKASNPKDALGIRKVPFSTISMPVLAELGVAMLEGALKYGRHNYRAIGVKGS